MLRQPGESSATALDRTLTNDKFRLVTERSDETALQGDHEWALKDSNLRPLPRQGRSEQALTSEFAGRSGSGQSQEYRRVTPGSVGSLTRC